jgi:transposase
VRGCRTTGIPTATVADLNEEYIEKMEDVLETYEKPLSSAEPVVRVDEKPVTLHKDVREPIPMKPGSVAKRDNEYERCGTANVFCGIQPKDGVHFTKVTPNRSSPEFAQFLQSVANRYPQAETIHLVMDNLSSHTRKALVDRFGESTGGSLWDRFTVHYTPTHGSWLNQAEIEISLSRQCLGRRRIGDRKLLETEARAWNRTVNRKKIKINWTFDRKRARQKFKYKYKTKRSKT